jgi:hypothetical protein
MTDDRIAALEAKIAAAQAELAEIKSGRVAPQQPPKDGGVRILQVLAERTDGLPSLKELEKLYSAVKHLAPWPLNNKYDEHKPFRGFCACFRWISNKGRTEFPNPKFALSFWLDQCKNWTKDRDSMTNDISGNELVMAVFAAGDVKFCAANAQLGIVWELALSEYSGRPASDAWRKILREGASAVLPPSAPARRQAAPSQVRVTVGY